MTMTGSARRAMAGHVEKLFVKPVHGAPVLALAEGEAMRCSAGLGIEGDVHANRLSPRQVLITVRSELDALAIDAGALHENVVLAVASASVGALRPGAALLTDRGVEIWLTMYCEPCRRIAAVASDLTALIHRRGVLGRIVVGGEIVAGDAIALIPGRHVALPESPLRRFQDVVASIPQGRVLRYRDVTMAMGVADSFVRAIPGYIRRTAGTELPTHRIVDVKGRLPAIVEWQAKKLEDEGVRVRVDVVDLNHYLWRG